MAKGYCGKIVHVDLDEHKIWIEKPDESFYRYHLGGSSLNLSYLLEKMAPGIDPLSPGNVLAFSVGVFTGAQVSGLSRLTVTARSPLTGAIGDAQCGGYFPAKLKSAGFDAVIVYGKSPSPVYLWIDQGKVELKRGEHLWGKSTGDSEALIRKECGCVHDTWMANHQL